MYKDWIRACGARRREEPPGVAMSCQAAPGGARRDPKVWARRRRNAYKTCSFLYILVPKRWNKQYYLRGVAKKVSLIFRRDFERLFSQQVMDESEICP